MIYIHIETKYYVNISMNSYTLKSDFSTILLLAVVSLRGLRTKLSWRAVLTERQLHAVVICHRNTIWNGKSHCRCPAAPQLLQCCFAEGARSHGGSYKDPSMWKPVGSCSQSSRNQRTDGGLNCRMFMLTVGDRRVTEKSLLVLISALALKMLFW